MRMSHVIDTHKALTPPVVLAMMVAWDNFGVGPWVYLALHGSYGIMWCYKSQAFPDRSWEEEVGIGKALSLFFGLALYWAAPFLLISSGATPPGWLVCFSVAVWGFGTLLHFGADAQKHFVLEARPGLITNGFFDRTRNPNYLGEILIYVGYAALSMHWIPWLVNAFYWAVLFVPNMKKKDESISRHPGWDVYVARTGLLLPRLGRRPPMPERAEQTDAALAETA